MFCPSRKEYEHARDFRDITIYEEQSISSCIQHSLNAGIAGGLLRGESTNAVTRQVDRDETMEAALSFLLSFRTHPGHGMLLIASMSSFARKGFFR